MDELLSVDAHELTVETITALSDQVVVAISTCSCARWASRTQAAAVDRQLLLSAIAGAHRGHTSGADQGAGWRGGSGWPW